MIRFKSILYVCDAAATQESALERAVSLAENNQADLTLIDVLPPTSASFVPPSGGPSAHEIEASIMAKRRQLLESLAEPYRQRLKIRLEMLVGKTFFEVIRAVLRDGHDLVIKPAENPKWTDRLFGSDDMHLLRKCPCPVWLMKLPEKSNYECIVAAIDFDPLHPKSVAQGLTGQILELSSSLALSDFAALHLVHAWDVPEAEFVQLWSDNPKEARSSLIEGEYARRQQGMDRLRDMLRHQIGEEAYGYLAPRFHLTQGSATRVIPQLVDQLHADLVVMGTVARTGIAGFLIGNTAEEILYQLRCPVLALKPPGFVSPVKPDA